MKTIVWSNAFICRPWVETCSDLFAETDPAWRDLQIARLAELSKKARGASDDPP